MRAARARPTGRLGKDGLRLERSIYLGLLNIRIGGSDDGSFMVNGVPIRKHMTNLREGTFKTECKEDADQLQKLIETIRDAAPEEFRALVKGWAERAQQAGNQPHLSTQLTAIAVAPRLTECIPKYIQHLQSKKRSAKTLDGHAAKLREFATFAKDDRVSGSRAESVYRLDLNSRSPRLSGKLYYRFAAESVQVNPARTS